MPIASADSESPFLSRTDSWRGLRRGALWNSLIFKLTLLVALLLVVTAGGLTLLTYTRVRDMFSNQIAERLQVVAGARQGALHRFVHQQQMRISLLGRSARIRELLNRQQTGIAAEKLLEETNGLLKDAQEHTPGFLSISLLDPQGRVMRSTEKGLQGKDLSADVDVQAGLKQPHLGAPRQDDGRFVASLVGPAQGLATKKNDVGAILVRLDMAQAEAILEEREGLQHTGRVFLGVLEGDKVRFLLNREVSPQPREKTPAMMRALEGQEGFIVTTDREQPVLAAYRPLDYGGWGIVAQLDVDEAFAPIARLRQVLMILVCGALLAGLGSSYLLARQFAQPVIDLAEASTAVGEGRWETRVAVYSDDELGLLSQAFNRMTEELGNSYSLLEDRVAGRTAALAKSEQDNRDQRQILESILNSMGDGVAVCDPEGHFLIFNTAARRMLGLGSVDAPIEEWPGIYGIFLPDGVTPCPAEALPLARALRGENTDSVDLFIRREDLPEGVWLSVSGRPMWDHDGQLRGGVVVFRNMTLQRNAEQALRQAQARYMSLVESLPLAVWSKDRAGYFTFANQLLAELLGRPTEEIVGKTDLEFFPVELAVLYRADDEEVMSQFRVLEKVETLTRPDGQEIFIQSFKAPLFDAEGKVIGTQGLCWDISPLKRTEAALRLAREEADAANRAKSAFLANISHEIRTPMNGVLGIMELVLDTPLSSEQRAFLKIARESGNNLLNVINDILDFSKIEAGRMELDLQPFDLAEEAGDCLQALAVKAQKKGLGLTCRFEPTMRTRLIGDAGRFRQVLTNLIGNAIKFTSAGEVVVDLAVVDDIENDDPASAWIRARVHDTGIGIAPEKLEKVFVAFEQADASMTRRYGGTGLGLSISSRLVELMEGKLSVSSAEGEGSTFEFTAHVGLQNPPYEAHLPVWNELRGLSALLVLDPSTQREVLLPWLSRWGLNVTTVANTAEARQQLSRTLDKRPFDFVIVDSAASSGDGTELAKEIAGNRVLTRAVVLLVTAECSMSEIHSCRESGVELYVVKPVKPRELLDSLASVLQPAGENESRLPEETAERMNASRSLRILLVEDSEVNQIVAIRLLERRGHKLQVANNGAEALEMLADPTQFDAVLMDVQMPVLDGLKATAEIRRREQTTGRHLPIIAMTAHAVDGDRERCLSAGMDGYVVKPVRPKELFDAVERLALPPEESEEQDELDDAETIVDWDAALRRLNGDRELLGDMVIVFRDEVVKLRSRIQRAIEVQDAAELRIAAHTLKGAVGNFVAKSTFQAALRLETLAKDGNFTEVPAAQAWLERELERLLPAMLEYPA